MTDRLWPLVVEADLAELPEPEWLIDQHVTNGMTLMYGAPKSGKTFLAVAWAMSIASGQPWHGTKTKRTPVVYVSGEGVGGLAKRTEAWRIAEHAKSPPMYVVPFGARLVDREHVVALRDDVHATGAGLLVVDTLARSMAGADENSQQDMGHVVQACDWLREKTGCAVLLVHHSGVDGSRPRGSSSLFGAVDTLVRVEGDGRMVDVSCEGQKDAAPFRRRAFELSPSGRSVVLAERKVSAAASVVTPF